MRAALVCNGGTSDPRTLCVRHGARTSAPASLIRVAGQVHAGTRQPLKPQQQVRAVATVPRQPHHSSSVQQQRGARQLCRATLDEPELQQLVRQLDKMTPPPPEDRPMLDQAVAVIDGVNSRDPSKVPVDGVPTPYRLAYATWLTQWVLRLEPKASDELLLVTRGRNVEGWRLAEIKRDDYAPNTTGMRQWEADRKRWQCQRLTSIMQEVGYPQASIALVTDVMMGRNIPDPRDIRKYDLIGPLGMINFKTLQAVCMLQTIADAEGLLFLEKNFEEMFNRMPADEVAGRLKKELGRLSQRGVVMALKQNWSPVQQRILRMALPVPVKYNDIMMEVEGVAAGSTHPGDWRYKNFDYN